MFHNCFFSSENDVIYEIMWKYTVEPDRPRMTIWVMRIECWMTKANTCSDYAILTAFPLKQRLHERTHLSVTLYVQCLSCLV